MKIRNVNPLGDVAVAALGMKLVRHGEEVDVPEDVAGVLLIQTENWEAVDEEALAFAAVAVARHRAELDEASRPAAAAIPEPDPEEPEGDEPTPARKTRRGGASA